MPETTPHIAILGAGPIGLEAALAAAEAGLPFTLYEASDAVGGSVRDWAHVRLFTPWEMNVSPRARCFLARAGHAVPDGGACPTGGELYRELLAPLAALPEIAPRLELGARVVAIGRQGLLKHESIGGGERAQRRFRLVVDRGGDERVEAADVVLDCSGSYAVPNALGDGGIPAPGERALAERIHRRIPDLAREAADWAGLTVLLVGAGHSAQTAARDLADLAHRRPGTRLIWALRREEPGWAEVGDDPLPERRRLAEEAWELASGGSPVVEARRGVVVERLAAADDGRVEVVLRSGGGREQAVRVDRVLALTGSVGDHLLYRQLQVHECYATSGPMKLAAALLGEGSSDCLDQTSHGADTLANPEPGFFILGAKSYGRTNTFLLRVGWQQVDEVMSLLAAAGVPV